LKKLLQVAYLHPNYCFSVLTRLPESVISYTTCCNGFLKLFPILHAAALLIPARCVCFSNKKKTILWNPRLDYIFPFYLQVPLAAGGGLLMLSISEWNFHKFFEIPASFLPLRVIIKKEK
jgi:hypothetical protein